MLSRRALFALSVVLSLLFYAALLYLAPRVTLFEANATVRPLRDVVHVNLDQLTEPAPQPAGRRGGGSLVTRPGDVRDLLARGEEIVQPERSQPPPADVPNLSERIAQDTVERAYDLALDAEHQKRADARILEIAQDDARRNIEVVRRLVRPGPTRILEEDELPTLRTPVDEELVRPSGQGAARSLLADAVSRRGTEPGASDEGPMIERDSYEPPVMVPMPTDAPPEAKVEATVARAPVVEAVREEQRSQYVFLDDLVDIKLDTYVPDGEGRGYFRLRILPREGESIEVLPKDVTFVIDASNSIVQRKLDLTVRGVRDAIGMLRESDSFNVIVFRDTPNPFRPDRVAATAENKSAAYAFLDGLKSRGETDVYQGILPVLQGTARSGAPSVVVVLSDGRPTTGLRDGRTIINALTSDNDQRQSVFAFGGGRTVNRYLLDLLAYRNKGECLVTDNIDDIDRAFPRLFQTLADPLLVDLDADYGRIAAAEVYPKEIADFYRGRPITVYGIFETASDREFVMRLTGNAAGRRKEVVFRADLREAAKGDKEIARNWAFQKAYYLIGEISKAGETPELMGQLRGLSQQYGIRTSYDE